MIDIDVARLTERQQYWLNHLRACDASGLTSIDYAREHGIKVKSLYSARKALAKKGTLAPHPRSSAFQKVAVAGGNPISNHQWQVQLPNGAIVSFGGSVDAGSLSVVLDAVAKLR